MIGTGVIQVIGGLIIAAAFMQVAVLLYGTWRGANLARVQQGLANDLLRRRVDAETLSRDLERKKTTATWSGVRKFQIRDKIIEGGGISSFYLVPHDGKVLPPFQPGQYLTFNLRLPDREKPLVRCYSLSDSPLQTDYYRVSIKRQGPPPKVPDAPPGLSSSFFHDSLQAGDIVDVKAPSGNFFLDLSKHRPVVLIGGGVGLTPMISMLNAICDAGAQRETWFFYGVRNGDEHIMREHLEALEAEHENIHLQVCYSDPKDDEVAGEGFHHSGRVSVDLFKKTLPSSNYEFYVCGPPPMMESLAADLRAWGVPDADIFFEAFGPASVKKTAPAPDATAATGQAVTFTRSNKTITWDGSQGSILELAEANGVELEFGCRAGSCGTCITAVKSGEVSYVEEPGSLPESGSCLTCISVPKSNLALDA
ncbi:MAG: 2Fe-2S iron-sulfur cluster binding domain-containing protein [Alphaproteobacteria bacterium]|nr:2Fe-2S iron-sulfur cluster binding domain-containing protein [Alphaproteobacteria bacterium]